MEGKDLNQSLPVGAFLKSPTREYKVESVLGKGGFGITYKVSAVVMFDKIPAFTYFAVKEFFMKDASERDATSHSVGHARPMKERVEQSRLDFLSEARRLHQISGDNAHVVPVSEVFEANGTVYYVMEYLTGGTLTDLVKQQGPMSQQEALAVIRSVADAVSFLHRHQINHLDIKPDNVMFRVDPHSGQKVPVLIDFGLAKHFDESGNPTSTIRVQGCSDGYAPVEQYSGLQTFSPEADVYALGATLFYMLTGKTPVISAELQPDTVEKSLAGLANQRTVVAVKRAMAYRKFDRTPTVEAFLADLSQETQPSVSSADFVSAPTHVIGEKRKTEEANRSATKVIGGKKSSKPATGKKLPAGKIVTVVVSCLVAFLLAGGGVWYYLSGSEERALRQRAQADYADYEELCEECQTLIDSEESTDHHKKLLEAKRLFEQVENYEKDYAGVPDLNYSQSGDFRGKLNNALAKESLEWEAAAKTQLDLTGDISLALSFYRLANDLCPSPELEAAISQLESHVSDAVYEVEAADSAAYSY